MVCYLLCYNLVIERVRVETPDRKQESVLQMLRSAVHNRALISIIAASIVMLLAQLTMQGMSGYVYPDYYNNAAAQSASTITMMVGMMLAAILWFWYPLHKKQVEENVQALKEKHAAEA